MEARQRASPARSRLPARDPSGAAQSEDLADEPDDDEEDDDDVEEEDVVLLDSLLDEDDEPSFEDDELSFEDDPPSEPSPDELVRPLADAVDDRESVMYHPLPLNTIPTGWITLRSAPPHCSHVVSGGSEKLWRFSMISLQAVQV